MAYEEQSSDKNAPVLNEFAHLFLRKLGENLVRKNQSPSRRIYIKKLDSVYGYEISCMMHTLGDVAKPLNSSVQYLETILRDQMNLLLIKASENSDSKALTHAHLLPLIANKREKVTRLLQYLFLKDTSELLGKKKYAEYADAVEFVQRRKRVATCLKFLQSIGAGDYDAETLKPSLFHSDDITLERAARRFQMSRTMSSENYLTFSKKQAVCFYPKLDRGVFKDWILADKVTTLQPTPLALDILSYFAKETVAEIVEATLQVGQPKKDSKLDIPNILEKNNHQLSTNRAGTFSSFASNILNTGTLRSLIADNSDSSSSVNSGSRETVDIFGSSPCAKKRKMETMDSDKNNNNEMGEISQEPKIPPRNPGNPITVEDLRTTVMNLIILSDDEFPFRKRKKRILCL